jgi:hypothetical protein
MMERDGLVALFLNPEDTKSQRITEGLPVFILFIRVHLWPILAAFQRPHLDIDAARIKRVRRVVGPRKSRRLKAILAQNLDFRALNYC